MVSAVPSWCLVNDWRRTNAYGTNTVSVSLLKTICPSDAYLSGCHPAVVSRIISIAAHYRTMWNCKEPNREKSSWGRKSRMNNHSTSIDTIAECMVKHTKNIVVHFSSIVWFVHYYPNVNWVHIFMASYLKVGWKSSSRPNLCWRRKFAIQRFRRKSVDFSVNFISWICLWSKNRSGYFIQLMSSFRDRAHSTLKFRCSAFARFLADLPTDLHKFEIEEDRHIFEELRSVCRFAEEYQELK